MLTFAGYSGFVFNPEHEGRNKIETWILALICILYSCFELFKQFNALKNLSFGIKPSIFWICNDIISSSLIVAFSVFDIIVKEQRYRNSAIGSFAMFSLWLKLFYYLRIFAPISAFIRMIIEIVKDMSTFLVILFASILAFANSFFILDGSFLENKTLKASGGDVGLTFASTYMMGLGEWDTDKYQSSEHTILLWVFFLLCTFLVQIVLLNLLIALMEDTFDKVSEVKE